MTILQLIFASNDLRGRSGRIGETCQPSSHRLKICRATPPRSDQFDFLQHALSNRLKTASIGGEPNASGAAILRVGPLLHESGRFYGAYHGRHGLLRDARVARQLSQAEPVLLEQRDEDRAECPST